MWNIGNIQYTVPVSIYKWTYILIMNYLRKKIMKIFLIVENQKDKKDLCIGELF